MSDFPEFPKIPRLSRDVVITEKLDGTNGLIQISDKFNATAEMNNVGEIFDIGEYLIKAGSRSRWLDTSSKGDNYGFAKFVRDNAEDLSKLGPGLHYGEWWGQRIQRGYDVPDKRFSLFNTHRWSDPATRPVCCKVVPTLYQGVFDTFEIDRALNELMLYGSDAAPDFMNPEGIIIYHTAANQYFKKTIEKDHEPKNKTS